MLKLLWLFLLLPLTHIIGLCHLSNVSPCTSSLVFLSFGLFFWVLLWSILRKVPKILLKGLPWCLSLWWDFCCRVWFRETFSFDWGTLFFFSFLSLFFSFVSTCFDLCPLSTISSTYIFPFSPNVLILWRFGCSTCLYLSFSILHYEHFSMPNSIPIFWLYILIVCVTWSTTERREIRNFPNPSMFELIGRQRLTVKKRNRTVGQFLAAAVTNPGQNESQQMFALCDWVKEIVVRTNRLTEERG